MNSTRRGTGPAAPGRRQHPAGGLPFCAVASVAIAFSLISRVAAAAPPAVCPFNVAVVDLAPHTVNGFSWGSVIRPMSDPCISEIAVDPTHDQEWYVGGLNGLYMTKDGGMTWTKPLSGPVGVVTLVPSSPPLVYVGVANKLYLSRDAGRHWIRIETYSERVTSVLAANGTLYVGLGWSTHSVPSGVWVSNLGGGLPSFHAFGPGHTGLIVWTLARSPLDGTLYAGTEIADHLPAPYHPPFFRSTDGGVTWKNVAGALPWHVISAAVRPTDGAVYALTEGAGLFGSSNKGATWLPLSTGIGPTGTLLMDPVTPTRLFGGRQKLGTLNGGAFLSVDSGKHFAPIGLAGAMVTKLDMNGARTRLFAATYASGIYIATMP